MKKRVLVIALCIAGISCASAKKNAPEARESSASGKDAEVAESDAAIVGGLADSAIPKGACGMVLWTLDEDRPMPIFRYVAGKEADVVLNGKAAKLTLQETSGASSFGVAETQKFVNDDGLSVLVETRFSLGFDGGAYLERGVVSIVTAGGWKTVVPTAGLAGCRA